MADTIKINLPRQHVFRWKEKKLLDYGYSKDTPIHHHRKKDKKRRFVLKINDYSLRRHVWMVLRLEYWTLPRLVHHRIPTKRHRAQHELLPIPLPQHDQILGDQRKTTSMGSESTSINHPFSKTQHISY